MSLDQIPDDFAFVHQDMGTPGLIMDDRLGVDAQMVVECGNHVREADRSFGNFPGKSVGCP